jgi:nitroreductase
MSAPMDAERFFEVLKTRRVVRSFTEEPVSDDDLWKMAQAGRWAANGGNLHPHRFLIVRDPRKIRLVRSFSPGMLIEPPALVVLLTDHEAAKRLRWDLHKGSYIHWVDTGTAAQNMMNMAHALGLGSCPVTSYSHSGVATVLGLPAHMEPELLLMVGHPRPVDRQLNPNAPKPITTRDLTYWDEVGLHEPGERPN